MINCSKNIQFDEEYCRFYLTQEASEIIYRQKGIIVSYSGSNEWANHFVCEMLDLYTGSTPFSYCIDSFEHEKQIRKLVKENDSEAVISYIREKIETLSDMFIAIDRIIDELPTLN